MDFTDFIYEQEKNPQVISLLLKNGSVVSGKFATPRPPSIYPGIWKYDGVVLLKSVTVVRDPGDVAKLPELLVPEETVVAWGVGKLTPARLKTSGKNSADPAQ